MMDQPPSILSVASYTPLRHTREWILQRAGFNVTSAAGFDEAMAHCRRRAFDLVIIADSLTSQQKQALINEVRKNRHTRVLLLIMRGDPAFSGVDYALEDMQGPEKLLEVIRAALKKNSRLRGPGGQPGQTPTASAKPDRRTA